MPLSAIFSELADHLASPKFLLTARHPDHPTAFTRDRKLPLASLVAVLLSGMRINAIKLVPLSGTHGEAMPRRAS